MNISTIPSDAIVKATQIALVAGYVISLLAIFGLAALHDGTLADTAMQTFRDIAIATGAGGTLWGAAHTVTTNIFAAHPAPAAASTAPVAATAPATPAPQDVEQPST